MFAECDLALSTMSNNPGSGGCWIGVSFSHSLTHHTLATLALPPPLSHFFLSLPFVRSFFLLSLSHPPPHPLLRGFWRKAAQSQPEIMQSGLSVHVRIMVLLSGMYICVHLCI